MLAEPIESILRSSPAIKEVVLFGASRPILGILVIPSALAHFQDHGAIIQAVRELNKTSASHQEIMDRMTVVLPPHAVFPKASKGTVLRPKALEKFRDAIEEAYTRLETGEHTTNSEYATVKDDDLLEYVRATVKQGLPIGANELGDDDDLFVAGVTSLKASLIRGELQQVRLYRRGLLSILTHQPCL